MKNHQRSRNRHNQRPQQRKLLLLRSQWQPFPKTHQRKKRSPRWKNRHKSRLKLQLLTPLLLKNQPPLREQSQPPRLNLLQRHSLRLPLLSRRLSQKPKHSRSRLPKPRRRRKSRKSLQRKPSSLLLKQRLYRQRAHQLN